MEVSMKKKKVKNLKKGKIARAQTKIKAFNKKWMIAFTTIEYQLKLVDPITKRTITIEVKWNKI